MLRRIFSHRYPLLLLALSLLGIGFGYHGYSHHCFLATFGAQDAPVWGRARTVRSDDWVVNFPIQISQTRGHPLLFRSKRRGRGR